MLKVYGMPTCGKCLILKHKLEKKGIPFEYHTINQLDEENYKTFKEETAGILYLPMIKTEEGNYVDYSWVEKNLLK